MSQQTHHLEFTYTDCMGNLVHCESLDWLEEREYWDEDQGDWLPCSRYYIGSDALGDSQSVWLNADLEEVDPEAYPDEDEDDGWDWDDEDEEVR